ncbi:GspE/PulE family protein [Caldimonas thermodepolymerans]|uniref:GspE/PulE family protein n=1 Tax=Caldimonas thermodepolymerans TaxID=215580 RepID=UPI000E2AFAB1|nr:GspE/PulE family protein [Caldimonas thermodepolymerans]RDI02749.1 type II secretory ATPase GspE/PulE/Tfp pilus assembly ATPase PilB-like protein [Caldimonas thermodepolymerans]
MPVPAPLSLIETRRIPPDDLPEPTSGPISAAPAVREKSRRSVFRWPTPPFGAYPEATEQQHPICCEIEGLNGRQMAGRLIFFVPEETVAHVQVPPARTTMPVQFSHFRSLHLLEVLRPIGVAPDDPHADMLDRRPRVHFIVRATTGRDLEGETVGHVETKLGLFLFPPADEHGGVTRLFIPRHAYRSVEIGPRVGEVLVTRQVTTQDQVDTAASQQTQLRGRKLGDLLVAQKIVNADRLMAALEQQARAPAMRIGEALVSLGVIDEQQLQQALAQQARERSMPLGELLVQRQWVSRQELQTALAYKMGYPLVDVTQFPVEAQALGKLPYLIAVRLNALPLLLRGGRLVVALEDPSRSEVLEELEFHTQLKIVPALAQFGALPEAIQTAYEAHSLDLWAASSELGYISPVIGSVDPQPENARQLAATLMREAEAGRHLQVGPADPTLLRLVHAMIVDAHEQGVTDIHVECYPGQETIKVRFRKDGLLQDHLELPYTHRQALVSRLKIMSNLDVAERRRPQDGRIDFARFVPNRPVELRVATIPTHDGLEDVVMRILTAAQPLPLEKLRLSAANLDRLKEVLERPQGLVLCVGPTGAGKTTTLHSALSFINVPERKIWTAEDPIEIAQPGLRQVQIDPRIGWTYARALRAFLRADPDVIMAGEVRDRDTALVGIEASLSGHLVLSSLYAGHAVEAVSRLVDMGLDPFNVADALQAVLAQRLVRRLCEKCRQTHPATDEEVEELLDDYLHGCPADAPEFDRDQVLDDWLQRFGHDGRLMHHYSPGCPHCHGTGFHGRTGMHELMVVSRELRRLVRTGATSEELQQQALREGMRTLRQDGIEKVLQGITSLDEVRAASA